MLQRVRLWKRTLLLLPWNQAAHHRALSSTTSPSNSSSDGDTLATLARVLRMPLLVEAQGATRVGSFVTNSMRIPRGERCVVVATASSAKRAGILPHFLRRAGYFPLLCELPDGSPREAHVGRIVDAAKRTGSSFVAAFGGSAVLHVGKAAAALLANEGRVSDFSAEEGGGGGQRSLEAPSLPFLAVPSCPGGGEASREAMILCDSIGLVRLAAHPASPQGVLIDPALAVSMGPLETLVSAYATLVSCMEGALRLDIDKGTRNLAFNGVQRAAGAIPVLLRAPNDLSARQDVAVASVIGGFVSSGGAAGACRGLGLSVAGKYNISYASVISAVAPETLAASLDLCLQRYEETEAAAAPPGTSGEDGEDDDEAGPRRLVDAVTETQPRSAAMRKRIRQRLAEEEGGGAKPGDDDDDLRSLLVPYASAAAEALNGKSTRLEEGPRMRLNVDPAGVDEDAVASILRFGRLARIVRGVLDSASRSAVAAPAPAPSAVDISSPVVKRDLAEFGQLLRSLRDLGKPIGVIVPSLATSYALSDFDLAAIADTAEVDSNTLAGPGKLGKRDLLSIVERS